MILIGCVNTPETIEVTRVVTETVVEIEIEEVTRVITETVVEIEIVEVTPTVSPTEEAPGFILSRDAVVYALDGQPFKIMEEGTEFNSDPTSCSRTDPQFAVSWWIQIEGYWLDTNAFSTGYDACDNLQKIEFQPKGAEWRMQETSTLDVYVIRNNVYITNDGSHLQNGSRFYFGGSVGNIHNVQSDRMASFQLINEEKGSFQYDYRFPREWSIGWTELFDFAVYELTGQLSPEG
ncbi:MAG: hypothetical protein QY318_01040 [Candidatus Dojkabacteria bacterium]|nr:MAG: hypothetical protein QY318_01040 [Candidatus Dojkabacteria bacterium]